MENTCINCGQPITNKFCSNCGQRAGVKRITFREGWNDFWARIYGFDGMFPRTLKYLTIRPGQAAKIFLAGNRARYYGPVGYFFLMITLFLLALSLLGIDVVEFMKSIGDTTRPTGSIKVGSPQEKLMTDTMRVVTENLKLVSLIYIPFQAFASRFIFFRHSGYNFVEHCVLPLYLQGHVYWLSILSAVIFKILGTFDFNFVVLLISLVYVPFGYMNFFSNQPKVKAFFKGLGIYISAQLLFSLLVIIIVVILLFTNSEFYETLRPSNNR
ncbi:MAG: DUF3667 domain-containing protein [Flammeovirgaceae bacterium]